MKDVRVRLFVYGSLKRAGLHHAELRGAAFLSQARTGPGFRLEPSGDYQALVPAPGTDSSVAGELFEIPSELLPVLDEFEGEAYVREELTVFVPSSRPATSAAEQPREELSALAYFGKSR